MIIDVHSHAWEYPRHFNADFQNQARGARAGVEVDLTVNYPDYAATAGDVAHTIVFGGKARLSGLWVDDSFVADYVAQHNDRLIGFLSVDPTQDGWQRELVAGHLELGLRGIKLLPMYAGFRPDDSQLDYLWTYARNHGLPVLLHTGTTFIAQAPLECTLPRHIDSVATRFPEIKIILAHLGHPWQVDTCVVIRKHPNVFADLSGNFYRPFSFWEQMVKASEWNVLDKILFGTDWPITDVTETIDHMRRVNDIVEGTQLPRVDLDAIEAIIERDSLGQLGIE